MIITFRYLLIAAFLSLDFSLMGCAVKEYRFTDLPPVIDLNDRQPSPLPASQDYEKDFYYFNNLARRPLVDFLDVSPIAPSQDVNSLDEVPASTWFTPRLGYRAVSPEELLMGPVEIGPPQPPFNVTRAKKGGTNPGFFVKDSRGYRYLVKFDPPDFPGIQTTTSLIVNRLFWGFGYNVPEDHLVFFHRSDLKITEDSELSFADLDTVLNRVAAPENGLYRSTFSTFLSGKIVGPPSEKGTRPDDTNDRIPHENRRILRGMKVFCAMTNHSDIRVDNALDVYIGEPDQGHVVHYMLDFGEAFGGHGAEHDWMWDGYEPFFSYDRVLGNYFAFGWHRELWEDVPYTPWKSVGAFEADRFDPATWHETYQFLPIRLAQPDDDYWAAKIVSALTEEHIRSLVDAARYPEPEAAEYIVNTLLRRRDKVIEYSLSRVSPVEFVSVTDQRLVLKDFYRLMCDSDNEPATYLVSIYNDRNREVTSPIEINTTSPMLEIDLPDNLFQVTNGYLRIDIRIARAGRKSPRPAQFHLYKPADAALKLIGIVH